MNAEGAAVVVERGAGRREYRFNTADVIARRDRRRETENRERADGGDSAKQRHASAAAELKELQLAEKLISMNRVEDVAQIVAGELANVLAPGATPSRAIPANPRQQPIELIRRGEYL